MLMYAENILGVLYIQTVLFHYIKYKDKKKYCRKSIVNRVKRIFSRVRTLIYRSEARFHRLLLWLYHYFICLKAVAKSKQFN